MFVFERESLLAIGRANLHSRPFLADYLCHVRPHFDSDVGSELLCGKVFVCEVLAESRSHIERGDEARRTMFDDILMVKIHDSRKLCADGLMEMLHPFIANFLLLRSKPGHLFRPFRDGLHRFRTRLHRDQSAPWTP